MQSAFDPTSLLETEYSDDLRTRLTPIPEGEYYARVKQDGVKVRSGTDKEGKPWCAADVMFLIDDQEVKDATQLAEPQVKMGIFLELTPSGQLQTEKDNPNANVKLGRLKEALGIKAGKPWSLRHLEGLSCYIRVKNRHDPDDVETVYSDVVAVSKEKSAGRRAA